MIAHRPLVPLALAAALMLGQWLAAGHDTDHGLQSGAAHSCAVCVYTHGAGAGALPSFTNPSFLEAAGRWPVAGEGSVHSATHRHHPIRGPPTLPA